MFFPLGSWSCWWPRWFASEDGVDVAFIIVLVGVGVGVVVGVFQFPAGPTGWGRFGLVLGVLSVNIPTKPSDEDIRAAVP